MKQAIQIKNVCYVCSKTKLQTIIKESELSLKKYNLKIKKQIKQNDKK